MCTRKHSLRFWDRILGFKISSVMLLGNQPRSWSCRRSPKIQPGREERQRVPNSLKLRALGLPPVRGKQAEGRLRSPAGFPRGPLPSHPLMERLRLGVPPEAVGRGAALLGGTAPVPREAEEPPTPCAIAGPTRIDSGTHSQALSNLGLPHLWPGNPKRHPQKREASRGWWDGSWPRMPPSPSCWAALP